MLTSKPLMVAGCVAAVIGGTTFGWVVAGTSWQKGLPQTMMSPYIAPAAASERMPQPAAPAPAAKPEQPVPAITPDVTAPAEKKAEPKGGLEPTRAAGTDGKKPNPAAGAPDPEVVEAVGGSPRVKMPDIDIGTVRRYAKRYLDIAIDSDD